MAFDKMKQMYDLQKKAKEIQKKLAAELITATAGEGAVEVVMTGEQKLKSIRLDREKIDPERLDLLSQQLEEAVRAAMAEAQQVAAEEMKQITGDLGIPGMG